MQVYDISDFSDAAGIGSMSTGMSAKTASGTWAARTITGTSGQITVTNGNGISGNPTIGLATGAAAGNLGFTPENAANKSTDTTLGGGSPSDTLYASQKAAKAYVDAGIAAIGATVYQGTWNASTNSPSLASGVGTKGKFYTVSVAGTTTLDGISNWNVGDKAVFNGTAWEKIDGLASEVVSVSGRTGAVTTTNLINDIFQNGNLPSVNIASAATTDLTVATSPKINITGTTAITAFTVATHALYLLKFNSSLTLTHNSTSLILPGAANITTQAGDAAIMTTDGSGNCIVRHYTRASASVDRAGKNQLRNASFDIWQAGTSFTPAGSADTFVADRWKATRTGAATNYTVTKQSGFGGATSCMRIQRTATTTNTNAIYFGQQVLSPVAASLGGQMVAVSLSIRTGADFTPTSLQCVIDVGDGTDETYALNGGLTFATNNRSTNLGAVTIGAGQTYTRVSFTAVTLPSSFNEAFIRFNTSAFSSSAAGSNEYIDIADVKLEVSPLATPYEHPTVADELVHCLRNYQKSFLVATAPAQNAGAGTGELKWRAAVAGANANGFTVPLKAVMRIAPTVTLYNPAASNAQVRDETAGADCSSSTAGNITESSFEVTCTGNASTAAGGALGVHYVADARL